MYRRFLDNNRIPIILKSMTLYDNIQSDFNKFYLGKFSNQVTYSHLVYGIGPIGNIPSDPKYTNKLTNLYNEITLEYYYFNGKKWILDTELIGGTAPEDYSEYSDKIGHIYYQNKLEFPFPLLSYIGAYNSTQLSSNPDYSLLTEGYGGSYFGNIG